MHIANTHLLLNLADARRSDLERRSKAEFPRFGWLMGRTAGSGNTSHRSTPLTRQKAY